mgnify:CR=1 FL=1|tara:strand:- start:1598 stop:1894 length:297 start_codon:yes stop_codon:yes gene_type:complete
MVIIASIFVFCIAAVFRLLDNSAGLLISNGISVSPFYLPARSVKEEIAKIEDKKLVAKLRRTLIYQKLHTIFLILSILTFIAGVIYEFINPTLVYMFY